MISKRIVLHFPKYIWDKPIVYKLIKDYDLVFNILKARVTPREDAFMVLELSGEEKNYEEGIKYLKDQGVSVQLLAQDIRKNEDRCVHCGACITICPSNALYMDKKTFEVKFDETKCAACELCVMICPTKAMEILF